MGWAFENLFKNAMDAIGGNDGIIAVRASLPDPDTVSITVRDNGRGIDADSIARVFEPGFSTRKRGWGLGLAFVKRIVEEYHGGRIQIAHSAAGWGTTFEIELPVRGEGTSADEPRSRGK
jgi:signal transduction histidine kinase